MKLQKFGSKLMHDRERLMKFSLGNFSLQELCWSVQHNDKIQSREISDFVGKKELSPDESYRARYFGRKSIIVNEYANNALDYGRIKKLKSVRRSIDTKRSSTILKNRSKNNLTLNSKLDLIGKKQYQIRHASVDLSKLRDSEPKTEGKFALANAIARRGLHLKRGLSTQRRSLDRLENKLRYSTEELNMQADAAKSARDSEMTKSARYHKSLERRSKLWVFNNYQE